MVPLLLKLNKHYKGYPLKQVMRLDSKYAIRLYGTSYTVEYTNHRSLTIELDELRRKLGVEDGKYQRFDSLDRIVL